MPVEKTLKIEQAKEGESLGIKTLSSYNSTEKESGFKKELEFYNVSDIFIDTQIKKDGLKYIFIIKNQPRFLVDEGYLVPWIQKFYADRKENEKIKTEETIYIRLSEIKGEQVLEGIKGELKDLKKDIEATQKKLEVSTNIEEVKSKVERLIVFFEEQKKFAKDESEGWIFIKKYDRKDKGLRKIHKTEINRRLKELNKIKDQIERLANNKNKKYTIDRDIDATDKNKKEVKKVKEVKMDDVNALDMKITLLQLSQRIEDLGKEAPEFIKTRNDLITENGDTTPYYELIINNTRDAQKLKEALNKINDDYTVLNKISLSDAKRQALQQDLKALSEYLEKYINNPNTFDMSKEPFIFTSGDAIKELYKINPGFQKLAEGNIKAGSRKNEELKTKKLKIETIVIDKSEMLKNNPEIKTSKEYTPSTYSDAKEAFEKGGIGGVLTHVLDQTNMKPETKQFWGGVGNIAVIGGIVFVGWKMISSAFKLMTKKGRSAENLGTNLAWLGIPTALIIGSQARTGEGPLSLWKGGKLPKKIAGLRGGSDSSETKDQTPQDKETRLKYVEGFPGATALFNGLTYGEMKEFLIKDKDQIKIDPAKYDTLVDLFKNGSKKNEAAAKFLESIGKDDEKHVIDLALKGMLGKTARNDLEKNPKSNFNEAASDAIARLGSVATFMEDNKYIKINSETQYLVDDYISNGKDPKELEVLAKRGDVFYKEIEVVDHTGLAAKIKELANGDKEKEENLLLAINSFYDYMPNASKKIELTGTRPTITFKTYDQSSTINLNNKELVGFTPSRFNSYCETFKAASLTNRIRFLCKDKNAKSDKPFYLANSDITFDDAKIFSTSFDTEILESQTLESVSPVLSTYKQEYCDYLNSKPFRNQKMT